VINKAGMVPYYKDKNNIYYFMFMRPSNPLYGGKQFQFAKGFCDDGMTPIKTAIKEGMEELGLIKSNISSIQYIGVEKVKGYNLHLFGCNIIDKDFFIPPQYETGSIIWLTKEESLEQIRNCQKSLFTKLLNQILS
jgi:hypothetical protein